MAAVGVRHIRNEKELLEAQDWDIVEEYLKGHELSTECLVMNGLVLTVSADRNYEDKLKYAPAVIENGCNFPSRINPKILSKVQNITQKIVRELNIVNCAIKLDLLVKDNEVYVIEVAPRLGGGKLSSHLIPGVAGYDHWKMALMLACGIPIKEWPKAEVKGKFGVQRYKFPPEGVKDHRERLGSVECFGETYEEALNKCNANK